MIRYLLDTNACVTLIRRRTNSMERTFRRHESAAVGMSSITLAELQYGVARSGDPPRNALGLAHFCAAVAVQPFDHYAALMYGDLRMALEQSGNPIGPLDTLIAAHALSLDATLITNNEREFKRVPTLRIENWLRE